MRKIVLQMMTTLNGRLDDPAAWVHDVVDDQYRAIDRIYSTYDTVLVGRSAPEIARRPNGLTPNRSSWPRTTSWRDISRT